MANIGVLTADMRLQSAAENGAKFMAERSRKAADRSRLHWAFEEFGPPPGYKEDWPQVKKPRAG